MGARDEHIHGARLLKVGYFIREFQPLLAMSISSIVRSNMPKSAFCFI